MNTSGEGRCGRAAAFVLCLGLAGALLTGCTKDIMYGPGGEIIKAKTPKKTLKVKYKTGGKVEIKGARGIGGQSRVRIPPVPVETEEEAVGIGDVMIAPPSAPVVPAPVEGESAVEIEQTDVVH